MLPKHTHQIHIHISHLYLEIKSNITLFPAAEGFLTHFSTTQVCQFYFSWITLQTVFPGNASTYICIQNKLIHVLLQGRNRVKRIKGNTISVLPAFSRAAQTKSADLLILWKEKAHSCGRVPYKYYLSGICASWRATLIAWYEIVLCSTGQDKATDAAKKMLQWPDKVIWNA